MERSVNREVTLIMLLLLFDVDVVLAVVVEEQSDESPSTVFSSSSERSSIVLVVSDDVQDDSGSIVQSLQISQRSGRTCRAWSVCFERCVSMNLCSRWISFRSCRVVVYRAASSSLVHSLIIICCGRSLGVVCRLFRLISQQHSLLGVSFKIVDGWDSRLLWCAVGMEMWPVGREESRIIV